MIKSLLSPHMGTVSLPLPKLSPKLILWLSHPKSSRLVFPFPLSLASACPQTVLLLWIYPCAFLPTASPCSSPSLTNVLLLLLPRPPKMFPLLTWYHFHEAFHICLERLSTVLLVSKPLTIWWHLSLCYGLLMHLPSLPLKSLCDCQLIKTNWVTTVQSRLSVILKD